MNHFLQRWSVLLVVLLLAGWSNPATGQADHTLTIEAGAVYLDGQRVPADDLPEGLDLNGITAQFSYVGDAQPIFSIGGMPLTIREGRLLPASEANQGGVTVFFRQEGLAGLPPQYQQSQNPSYFFVTADDASHVNMAQQYVEQIREQAARLQAMNTLDDGEAANLVAQLEVQAGRAAEVVEALPRLELQRYLEEVSRYDRELYQQLMTEQQLEAESFYLAAQIRATAPGEERDQLVDDLRRKLETIFELKQENRRSEIKQLEQRLLDLNQRLEQREQMRQRVIERRIEELTGQ